jgi:mono/diheme cytochrome c family protein
VARGMLRADEAFYTGRSGGALVERAPVPVTPELVERGRDRFNIYCTPCHGRLGDGEGMVVMRGFQRPTSYHIDRLREAPDGHFFDVMTHGQGAMSSYAARIAASDRWAVAVYIRALQLSQSAGIDDVPPAEREKLTGPAK